MLVPFTMRLPQICGPLIEPLPTVIYGQSLVEQICQPQSAVSVGAGPIGLLWALYARARGYARIFLVAILQARLDWQSNARLASVRVRCSTLPT